MTPIPDTMTGQPATRPGDFKRNHFGAPIVTRPDDPTKTVVYGRPSGFGGNLENPYNLIKWKERQLLTGCVEIGLPDSTDRDELDKHAARAHEAAGSSLAADRGTHIHLLLERVDRLESWADLLAEGERLGIPAALQNRIVHQWCEFRDRLGVKAIAVEMTVVHDDWRLAGTLDRYDQATKPITCELGTIEPGDTFIGDIKTGSITIDDRSGAPKYWIKYPIQLAAYRDAQPYDTETGQRGEWPS